MKQFHPERPNRFLIPLRHPAITVANDLSDRLRMAVAARPVVIQGRDVDPREPWPDGRHRTQDQAVPV